VIVVRGFRPGDRPAVRRICHQAGYMGAPADWYWRHAESFADVWTGYYTDREPESFFVADRDGEVLGYLAGCVDSARAPSPKAALTRAAIRHGLLLRPGTAGFFWRGIRESLGLETPTGELRDPRWPAHLHIDLLPQARGQGVGTALMQEWFARLRALGVPGCHLSTFAENAAAIRFFERMGFRRHGERIRTPGMRTPAGEQHHLQYLVRDL
jgi:ribosomal protein S18 acetylase RimI-like enzyme